MAKGLPTASDGAVPGSQAVSVPKTPVGVWVIVGMAIFFVTGGLGISAFIVWKAMGEKKPIAGSVVTEEVKSVPNAPVTSGEEVGVDHPRPNPATEDARALPGIVHDRTEEDRTRQEVLKRIDLMRALSDADKDKLYAQVERARGFTKIAVIPFSQNRTVAGAAQVEGLIKSLHGQDLQRLLSDPTVALIMVGYADKKGDEAKNLDVSRTRAEGVVKTLKEKTDVVNVMHAVGMGGQDLFNPSDLEKNPVVEVWAVQP
jgi:outer membrane protein OmpA-like peptidoglycan-associated protein